MSRRKKLKKRLKKVVLIAAAGAAVYFTGGAALGAIKKNKGPIGKFGKKVGGSLIETMGDRVPRSESGMASPVAGGAALGATAGASSCGATLQGGENGVLYFAVLVGIGAMIGLYRGFKNAPV